MRFDTAGTKTVTLTVAGCAGSVGTPNTANQGICGALITAQTTVTITVSAFSGVDQYFDCNFVGTPLGTQSQPWNTVALMNTALAAGSVAMHIKPGIDCSNSTVGVLLNPGSALSKVRLDKNYPGFSGANPKFSATSGSQAPLQIRNGGSSSPVSVTDVVITDIDFRNVSASGSSVFGTGGNDNSTGTAGMSHIYLDNVSLRMECDCALVVAAMPGQPTVGLPPIATKWGFWNVTTYADPTSTGGVIGIGELGSPTDWYFRVGGSVTGPATDPTGDHHIYNEVGSHGLFQWITCGLTGSGTFQRNYCFNGNFDGDVNAAGQNLFVDYVVYAENSCKYVQRCVDLGNRVNNNPIFAATGSISSTTLTITAFAANISGGLNTSNGGSYLISGVNGGGSAITANTRIVGSATVNSGACTPSPCTGVEGGSTGRYAVSISQTFASAAFIGADSTVQYRNVVIADNAMDGMAALDFQCGLSVTIRDNRQFNTVAAASPNNPMFFTPPNTSNPSFRSGQPAQRSGFEIGLIGKYKIYRNKAFVQSTSYDAGLNPSLQFLGTWTGAQIWATDNTFVDARANNAFAVIPFTDMLASGAVIDRNTYSQTGSQLNAWYNTTSTSRTFAQWQAAGTTPNRWDASGVNLAGATPFGWSSASPVSWGQMN